MPATSTQNEFSQKQTSKQIDFEQYLQQLEQKMKEDQEELEMGNTRQPAY